VHRDSVAAPSGEQRGQASPYPQGEPTAISIENMAFAFPGVAPVMSGIDLRVQPGEIVVLVGPSGCGKSTVLNLIAGIHQPTDGRVTCFGKPVKGLNPKVAYMTQRDTLLPWRNTLDNAALPLEIKGVSRVERYQRARAELARVGVADAERRRPHQLSGGMRSRLSLACALLSDADILLMDEPFAAIDALLRVRLQQLLVDVWQETRRTMVYVTHDITEAVNLGHRVIVMGAKPGRIILEQSIDEPHPRRISSFRSTPKAVALQKELWDSLEREAAPE
jgi:NitT/TauT family transport system ATP-binding protein